MFEMVMNSCNYTNKLTSIFSQRSEQKFDAFKNYSNVGSIIRDYDKLEESNTILMNAFINLNGFVSKIKDGTYLDIYKSLVSPSVGDSKTANRIQMALNGYIAQLDESLLYPDADKSTKKTWDEELNNDEKQFVVDLAYYLNEFLIPFNDAGNRNLFTIVQGCINRGILGQNISEDTGEKRTGLGNLIGMVSRGGQGYNNIFGFLGNYDGYVTTDFKLVLPTGTPKSFKIKDLYSPSNDRMEEMFGLLFANSEIGGNDPIKLNPNQYRYAIKNMMKATEARGFWGGVNTFLKGMLKYGAIGKLSSYFLNLISGGTIGVSCMTTGGLNVMSYKKKNSKEKVNKALKMFGFKKDYFKLETRDPVAWIKNRVSVFYQNQFGIGLYENGPKDSSLENYSREDDSLMNDEAISYLLMGPMNILGDTIWRGNYQQIAMDMALQELKWTGELDNYLFITDENGRRIPNQKAAVTLLKTFLQKMSNISGFPEIEGGSQLNIGFEVNPSDGKLKRVAKSIIGGPATAVLQMLHWMTQRSTQYVNNTVRTLAGGTFNLVYDIYSSVKGVPKRDLYTKAYTGPGGKWLIKRYTRGIERGGFIMSWECARELVSKEEYGRELSRLAAGIRNVYRFGNIACRDENGELNRGCAWKNFLSVVYLPGQALQMAHPLIRALINIPSDYYKYNDYFGDPALGVSKGDVFADSILNNFVKPMLRSMYLLKIGSNAIDKTWDDDLNEDGFIANLYNAIVDSTEGILFYTDNELKSYVHSYGAYGPKSFLNKDTSIFGSPLELRETMIDIGRIKSIESIANSKYGRASRFVDMFATTRMIKGFISKDGNTTLYDSGRADKMLYDWNSDDDIMTMMRGYFTPEMTKDSEFMQYVWTNLTQDRQSYGASYVDGKRNSKYNKTEIDYFETLLKKDMDEARIANPGLSDLQIYDTALRIFFEGTPLYDQIKDAVQAIDDSGDHAKAAYTDYLASAAWYQEATGVKGLALVAEYLKRQYMEEAGLQYSSSSTKAEKEAIKNIENIVAAKIGTGLWLANRRQYSNLMGAWFIKKHPEYEGYDPFKNLLNDDGTINMNADLKTTGILGTALRANNLAKTELILGNTNGYELSNVFTEKFGSCQDENGNFVPEKAAQMIQCLNILAEALEDSGKSKLDISLILAPTLTKNLELWDYVLSKDTEGNLIMRDILGEEGIDQIRGLLYDTYNDTVKLDEFINEYLNDANVIKTLLGKNIKGGGYKSRGSLYYGKNTNKNYDYYKKPADAFNAWGSKNLSKLANGYGNSGKRSYAGNYNNREFYFLNQRSYRNNINSTRIAPDIPLTIGGFNKTTVKSKNPVSGYTTNIKPWKKGATPKFGKGKSIVGGEGSRGPVTNFKA